MSENLKPCPFCGSKYAYTHSYIRSVSKICSVCGAIGPVAANEVDAERLWNRRAEVKGDD